MNPFDLPPGLLDLERQLVERVRPNSDAPFRQRVLSAMQDERRMSRAGHIGRMSGRWALPLAGAVLLSLNLAMSLANHRHGSRAQQSEGGDITLAISDLRQRHPDLSEQEAYQLVVLVRSAPVLAAAPALPASRDWIIPLEGEESWDTH